jgi:hypothetical protein
MDEASLRSWGSVFIHYGLNAAGNQDFPSILTPKMRLMQRLAVLEETLRQLSQRTNPPDD